MKGIGDVREDNLDTKVVNKFSKSKETMQRQRERGKRTNNDSQTTTQKAKD
jgi:hypothetical protein